MRRWLRALGLALAGLAGLVVLAIAGVAVYVAARWDAPVRRPVRELVAARDEAAVARGRHLYNLTAACWECHGSEGGRVVDEPQAGGREFDTSGVGPGFGLYYGTNLTPDAETGIGAWSDGELVRAIREGINRQGAVIFPVMAYQFYHGLADADALAIVAYLRSLPPVRREIPKRRLSFPAKALVALGVIKPASAIASPIEAPPRGATVEYGRYLAWHASGCAECHTPRSPRDGSLDEARPMAGGLFALPEKHFEITGSNLTPDAGTGIGGWSEQQFLQAMRTGTRPDGRAMLTFMPWPLYSQWPEEDLRAVWAYLRSLAPQVHAVPPAKLIGAAATGRGAARGEALYEAYCLACHGVKGRGTSLYRTALRDRVRVDEAESIASTIANGVDRRDSPMPAFGKTLDAAQIADVVAYLESAAP